jgi:hypothetical protein
VVASSSSGTSGHARRSSAIHRESRTRGISGGPSNDVNIAEINVLFLR